MSGSTRLSERPAAAPPPPVLTVSYDPSVSLPLTKPVISIGRTAKNDLRLDHASVSREHAVIRRTRDGFALADLGSVNGVEVDGRRLRAHHPVPLAATSTVRIGDVELQLVYPSRLDRSARRAAGASGVHRLLRLCHNVWGSLGA